MGSSRVQFRTFSHHKDVSLFLIFASVANIGAYCYSPQFAAVGGEACIVVLVRFSSHLFVVINSFDLACI